jgi:hypothetical protein
LFRTGGNFGAPAGPEFGDTYVFPGSYGYDGQFYRLIAHHPTARSTVGIDVPRLRGRRILVPILAYALACGSQPHIDAAYVAVVLGFLFAGVYGWLDGPPCMAATLPGALCF